MFLKNKNIIFKIRRSKVTDYAALSSRAIRKLSNKTEIINLIISMRKGHDRNLFAVQSAQDLATSHVDDKPSFVVENNKCADQPARSARWSAHVSFIF